MQWGFVTAWSLGNGCVLSSAQLCNVSALERRHTNNTELQALCAAMRQSIGQDTLGGDYKCVTQTLRNDRSVNRGPIPLAALRTLEVQ